MSTGIEWTDDTWNPITGCTKISPGCAHCYAEAITLRFKRGGPFLPGKTTIQLHPDRLDIPIKWKRPRRIFVCSMSDLFHEEVPDDFIEDIFGVMAVTPCHTYQVLTKRPERALEWFTVIRGLENTELGVMRSAEGRGLCMWDGRGSDPTNYRRPGRLNPPVEMRRPWPGWPLPNVWIGTSVENQVFAERRIPLLLKTPAALHYLSIEPLLKAVDLSPWLRVYVNACQADTTSAEAVGHLANLVSAVADMMGPPFGWVIVGGESGPRARPMDLDWVRSLRDQCVAARIPFFYKQAGGVRPGGPALLDGREWREFPAEVDA